jgi:hypothetical protein
LLADLLARDLIEVYIGDDVGSRERTAVSEEFDAVRIGSLLLVRRDDGPKIIRAMRAQNGQANFSAMKVA